MATGRKTATPPDAGSTGLAGRHAGRLHDATPAAAATVPLRSATRRPVRLGFVELIDAAAVIAAESLGLFREEGLDVTLHREIGWANVRDKLAFHRLDAAATLIGMPLRSALLATAGEPLRAVMALGTGGDAITLSQRLVRAGVTNGTLLHDYVRRNKQAAPMRFAYVFESSVHHYLLRDWLTTSGLDPDRDVRLCVLPPAQMAAHLAAGRIDGCCVGEPWNTVAQDGGAGRIVALTSDLVPDHPDKVLAVNAGWADENPDVLAALVRALLHASLYCADPANVDALAATLARPEYLNVDRHTVRRSLALGHDVGRDKPAGWSMRSFAATFPSRTHAAWLVTQMQRWGHAPADTDAWAVAGRATDSAAYRVAAETLGLACPDTDSPPMRLRNGRLFAPPLLEGASV